MNAAVLVAFLAAIGNLLQGWDNATIASSVFYIKREFNLETQPAVEGLLVSMSLIGATIITTFSGPVSDMVGRRPMLMASSLFYFAGGLIMLWSPNVLVLLLGRLVDGLGVGLAVTLVPVYISETAPPEIRGRLNTVPQFTGSLGMYVSYSIIFAMTMCSSEPSWRFMLGSLSAPSLVYMALTVLYLPESPRWLVRKGRMKEARAVLEMLRRREDVSAELALVVEGLGTGGKTAIEEYVVGPAGGATGEEVTLYGPEQVLPLVAQPTSGRGSMLAVASDEQGSSMFKDPVVALLGSVHEKMPSDGLRTMLSVAERAAGDWDEENVPPPIHEDDEEEEEEDDEEEEEEYDDDNALAVLQKPLLSTTEPQQQKSGRMMMMKKRHSSISGTRGASAETTSTTGIGGGWQLAWKMTQDVGSDGVTRRDVKRMYMHEGEARGDYVHASALVSQSMLYTKGLKDEVPETTVPWWRELLAPGVRHALLCGLMLQILQQFSGINGVLYYTPQILDQAGVSVLLSGLRLSGESTSILISSVTTLLMMPSIGVAMRLVDVSGRRALLLWTIPVLILSLLVLSVANVVPMPTAVHATLSTGSVIVYLCCFVMGFGPIPNILCAEIFPTRVRGICIAICSLTFWLSDIAVTYSLPVMLNSVGLAGVFEFYAVVCCLALAFVALKVPETKGLPIEIINELFKIGTDKEVTTKEQAHDKDDENHQQQ